MKNNPNTNKKNDLVTLIFLIMIFSMSLVLRFNSLAKIINNESVYSINTPLYIRIIIPSAIGLALLYAARNTFDKSLKKIYVSSILPFIISPELFSSHHNMFLIIVNIVLAFLIIVVALRYLINNYGSP